LTFTPRGFNQVLNVKFPDSRLAVCEKCKKNYKTRESCRVRSGHNTAPWTTAYICITLDSSCTDEEGKFVDKPLTVRMSNWQPLCLKKDFSTSTPVCASCKKTNRTKSFCRERHRHRQLPWCTVYVILSAVESTDPSTVVAAPSQLNAKQDEKEGENEENEENKKTTAAASSDPKKGAETTTNKSTSTPAPTSTAKLSETSKNEQRTDEENDDPENETDNIHEIEESRTFLAQVSCKYNTIHWLEDNEGEPAPPTTNESDVKALNDAIRAPLPDLHHQAVMPPPHYYPILHPQYLQHQQHYAAWHSQYGQPMMMPPPPMMPLGPMGAPPPGPHPPHLGQYPGQPSPIGSPTKGENNINGNENDNNEGGNEGSDINATESALGPPGGEGSAGDENENKPSEHGTMSAPTSPDDAQAHWHAQMMYQQQMYHQHFYAHQQYMAAQHAHHAQMMNQQSPHSSGPGEHEYQHPHGGEGGQHVESIHDILVESKQEDDTSGVPNSHEDEPKPKRAKMDQIEHTSIDSLEEV